MKARHKICERRHSSAGVYLSALFVALSYFAVGCGGKKSSKGDDPAPAAAGTTTGGTSTSTGGGSTTSGGSSSTTTTGTSTLSSITVTSSNSSPKVGNTFNLTATGTYSNAATQDLTSSVTWSVSSTSLATITSAGAVTAVAQGSVTFTATTGGVSGQITMSIDPEDPTSIVVVAGTQPNLIGVKQQLQAMGIYANGSTADITSSVTWTSSSTSVATIDTSTNHGLASLLTAGSTTITATLGSLSATRTITVGAATLSSLSIAPATLSIANGYKTALKVTGTYSDSSTLDLTEDATWTSDTTSVATVSDTLGSKGHVTGASAGSATITATVSGTSTTRVVAVSSATLSSMAVSPSSLTIAQDTTSQLNVEGTFSDSSKLDLTNDATWSSSGAAVTVGNATANKGLITGVSNATATITAAKNSVSGTSAITVSAATLSSIAVTPATPSIKSDGQIQLIATGTFSDASTQVITNAVTWSSSSVANAVVSNTTGSKGLVSGVANGSATISAALDGVTGSTTVTVSAGAAAALSSITITPSSTTLTDGATLQMTATGTYTDGTTAVLGAAWTWASSDASVSVGANGLVSADAAGTSTVSVTKSGITGTSLVTVTADQAAPAQPASLAGTAVSTTSITFSWTSGGGTTASYKYAYQSGSSAPANCNSGTTGTTASTSVTLTGLTAGTQYSMIVCALNSDTTPEMGTASSSASMYTKPATPTNLAAATGSTTQINLTWDDMAGDTSGYKIAYKSGVSAPSTCDSDTTTTAAANATSKSITGLTAGTSYTFIICTVNGDSGQSAASSGVTGQSDTTPATPTSFTATASTSVATTINLAWDDVTGDAGGYKIAYQSGSSAPADCNSGTTTTAAANATSKAITGLTAATQYSFIVCSVNASSTLSTASSSASATTIPATPTSLAATASSTTQIDLTWDNMAGDSGGYKIAYQSGSSAPADCNSGTTTTAAADATSKSITGLSIATQYTFIICNVNSTSGQSVASTGVSAYSKPATPTNFAAAVASTTQINLTWDDMANDTGGYKIAYKSGSSAPANCDADTTTTAAADATSKSITGLTAGTQYSFLICNVSSAAGQSSASSGISKYTLPAAPSISATANSSSQITVSWAAVTGDTGGYKIAYASGASAPADCSSGTTTTAAAAATSKAITGLTASTQYTFIACTVNSDSGDSASSSSATATTSAAASSTKIVRPTGVVAGGTWDTSTYTNIDEAVTEPATSGFDGLVADIESSSAKTQAWTLGTITETGTISAAQAWVYAVCDQQTQCTLTSVRIRLNGTWYTATGTSVSLSTSYAWYSFSVTGLSVSMASASPAVEFTSNNDASHDITQFDAVYVKLTYTP